VVRRLCLLIKKEGVNSPTDLPLPILKFLSNNNDEDLRMGINPKL
jgi:hypothetical protein